MNSHEKNELSLWQREPRKYCRSLFPRCIFHILKRFDATEWGTYLYSARLFASNMWLDVQYEPLFQSKGWHQAETAQAQRVSIISFPLLHVKAFLQKGNCNSWTKPWSKQNHQSCACIVCAGSWGHANLNFHFPFYSFMTTAVRPFHGCGVRFYERGTAISGPNRGRCKIMKAIFLLLFMSKWDSKSRSWEILAKKLDTSSRVVLVIHALGPC